MPITLSTSVAVMEALACRRAVQFAKEDSAMVFKGDSAVVTQAITQGSSNSPEYGNIINDIKILAANFNFIQFVM